MRKRRKGRAKEKQRGCKWSCSHSQPPPRGATASFPDGTGLGPPPTGRRHLGDGDDNAGCPRTARKRLLLSAISDARVVAMGVGASRTSPPSLGLSKSERQGDSCLPPLLLRGGTVEGIVPGSSCLIARGEVGRAGRLVRYNVPSLFFIFWESGPPLQRKRATTKLPVQNALGGGAIAVEYCRIYFRDNMHRQSRSLNL